MYAHCTRESIKVLFVGFQEDLENDGTYMEEERIDLKGWVNVGVE